MKEATSTDGNRGSDAPLSQRDASAILADINHQCAQINENVLKSAANLRLTPARFRRTI